MAQTIRAGFAQKPGVQQFIKFCIIGASSTLIDISISYALIYAVGLNATLAKVISFVFSVSNGFFWNSRWTFRGQGSGRRHEMYTKFVAVNLVGLALNILLFKSVLFLFTGRFIGQPRPERFQFALATLTAIVCVSTWNFLANKRWTFNASKPAPLNNKLDVV